MRSAHRQKYTFSLKKRAFVCIFMNQRVCLLEKERHTKKFRQAEERSELRLAGITLLYLIFKLCLVALLVGH